MKARFILLLVLVLSIYPIVTLAQPDHPDGVPSVKDAPLQFVFTLKGSNTTTTIYCPDNGWICLNKKTGMLVILQGTYYICDCPVEGYGYMFVECYRQMGSGPDAPYIYSTNSPTYYCDELARVEVIDRRVG